MKKLSRICALSLVVVMSLFTLCACKKEPETPPVDTTTQYTASVSYTGSGLVIKPGKDRPIYTAVLRGVVVDEDSGNPIISQIKVLDKVENKVYRTCTDYLGRYEIEVPDGAYDLSFSRGSEYEIETLRDYIVYTNGKFKLTDIKLKKLYDVPNWFAGDLHMHSTYSDGNDIPSEVLKSNIAVGLSYGILSDHNTIYQQKEWSAGNLFNVAPNRNFIAIPGWEVTTNRGHYQAINVTTMFNAVASSSTDIIRIVNDIRLSPNSIAQINHPGRDDEMGYKDWNIAGKFDTIEIWNGVYAPPFLGGTNKQSYEKWVSLMNKGTRLAIVGGTDNHSINGKPYAPDSQEQDWIKRNTYSGSPRTYLYTQDYSLQGILTAIKNGNSFITNGPMIFADINGAKYGEKVAAAATLNLNYDFKSCEKIERLKVFVNGKEVKTITISGNVLQQNGVIALEGLKAGDWVNLQAFGEFGGYAITNPIFID